MNNNTNAAAAILALLNVPSLDSMPEAVKTAAAAEKQADELVKTAAAAAEKLQADINAAIMASDIAAAQKLLKMQSKTAAITLMPEDSRPSTPNGTEMTARGVIAVLNCIKVESK